jgi:hypothetical protein
VAFDELSRRLRQVLGDQLEPRLSGVQFKQVPVEDGYAVVIRIPKSYAGPHSYNTSSQGHGRFVMRQGTFTQEFSYEQLKSAFDKTATLSERARAFLDERKDRIIEGKSWGHTRTPTCVVQIAPVASFVGNSIDVKSVYADHWQKFLLPDDIQASSFSKEVNLDGIMIYNDNRAYAYYYSQIFRSGAIETVLYKGFWGPVNNAQMPKSISLERASSFIRNSIFNHTQQLSSLGVAGAALMRACLLNVEGYSVEDARGRATFVGHSADREHMVLPESWVENLGSTEEIESATRSILDILWQAFKYPSCSLYDRDGKWTFMR